MDFQSLQTIKNVHNRYLSVTTLWKFVSLAKSGRHSIKWSDPTRRCLFWSLVKWDPTRRQARRNVSVTFSKSNRCANANCVCSFNLETETERNRDTPTARQSKSDESPPFRSVVPVLFHPLVHPLPHPNSSRTTFLRWSTCE